MASTYLVEDVKFQNLPLRQLLLRISDNFKVLYNSPPKREKFSSPLLTKLMYPGGDDSLQMELENYEKKLKFMNSDENSNWMEVSFEKALQYSDKKWGLTGYISNEMQPPVKTTRTKRKFSDMTSSKVQYNLPEDDDPFDRNAAGANEGQDGTEGEGEDDDYFQLDDEDEEENSGGNGEGNDQPPPSQRLRFH